MMDRVQAEALIRALTGGNAPDIGDTIVFTESGWVYAAADSSDTHNHDDRYYTKAEVDALLAP